MLKKILAVSADIIRFRADYKCKGRYKIKTNSAAAAAVANSAQIVNGGE